MTGTLILPPRKKVIAGETEGTQSKILKERTVPRSEYNRARF